MTTDDAQNPRGDVWTKRMNAGGDRSRKTASTMTRCPKPAFHWRSKSSVVDMVGIRMTPLAGTMRQGQRHQRQQEARTASPEQVYRFAICRHNDQRRRHLDSKMQKNRRSRRRPHRMAPRRTAPNSLLPPTERMVHLFLASLRVVPAIKSSLLPRSSHSMSLLSSLLARQRTTTSRLRPL